MSLGVNPVPGTDAGYIISNLSETTDLEPTGRPIVLEDGSKAIPVETKLDAALREARSVGWEPTGEPQFLRNAPSSLYVTYLRRSG